MKILRIAVLTLLLTLGLAGIASASTMGVAVTPGESVTYEYYFQGNIWSLGPYAEYSWANDVLKLNIGYQAGDYDNPNTFSMGARYEITPCCAATLKYFSNRDDTDNSGIMAGLRGKYCLSGDLALTGKLEYGGVQDVDDYTVTNLFAQLEYQAAEGLSLTGGLWKTWVHYDSAGDADTDGFSVGIEYAFDKWDLYLDCDKDNDVDDPFITLGISKSF